MASIFCSEVLFLNKVSAEKNVQQLSNLDVRGVLQHGLPGGELSLGHGEISLQGTLSSDAGHLPLVLHLSQHSSSQRKMAQFTRFSLSSFWLLFCTTRQAASKMLFYLVAVLSSSHLHLYNPKRQYLKFK